MENGTIIEGEAVPVAQMGLGTVFRIPAVRQVVLLFGIAASVAAGFAIVLWSQTPGYSRLYEGLDGADVAEIADALRAADIDFQLNMDTGTVTVPEASMHDARLELASQGLPNGATVGMRSLADQPTFGQSQFRENALYQHALEGELGQTISHLGAIRDARVHLALPKQSVFMRESENGSASVMLNLYRGRVLEDGQVASIVHLVASSVPNLSINDVTVVDQQGRLLSSGDDDWSEAATTKQFQIAERLENNYKRRIETLLTPLLGPGRVRAEVVADMDFTVSEEMRESYDPNGALVSEHTSENLSNGAGRDATGVPGALSNQPPQTGGVGNDDASAQTAGDQSSDSATTSTRNYEVDRTISHTRPQAGQIKRLSIAVLVDDTPANTGDDAAPADQDLVDTEQVTALVKEAVGFDAERGDTVVVVKAAFKQGPEPEAVAEAPIWSKPIFMDSMKIVLGLVLALALVFGLVRPLMKSLLAANASSAGRAVAVGGSMQASVTQVPGGGQALGMPSFDEKVAAVKNITGHDPARVAQVVKQWVEVAEA